MFNKGSPLNQARGHRLPCCHNFPCIVERHVICGYLIPEVVRADQDHRLQTRGSKERHPGPGHRYSSRRNTKMFSCSSFFFNILSRPSGGYRCSGVSRAGFSFCTTTKYCHSNDSAERKTSHWSTGVLCETILQQHSISKFPRPSTQPILTGAVRSLNLCGSKGALCSVQS